MEPIALAIAALPFLGVFAWWLIIDRRDGLRSNVGTFIAVNLENTVVRGVLSGVYTETIVLHDAAELTEGGDISLAGAVVIPRSRITYIQTGPSVTADALV
jgi:hypothetical protein